MREYQKNYKYKQKNKVSYNCKIEASIVLCILLIILASYSLFGFTEQKRADSNGTNIVDELTVELKRVMDIDMDVERCLMQLEQKNVKTKEGISKQYEELIEMKLIQEMVIIKALTSYTDEKVLRYIKKATGYLREEDEIKLSIIDIENNYISPLKMNIKYLKDSYKTYSKHLQNAGGLVNKGRVNRGKGNTLKLKIGYREEISRATRKLRLYVLIKDIFEGKLKLLNIEKDINKEKSKIASIRRRADAHKRYNITAKQDDIDEELEMLEVAKTLSTLNREYESTIDGIQTQIVKWNVYVKQIQKMKRKMNKILVLMGDEKQENIYTINDVLRIKIDAAIVKQMLNYYNLSEYSY